MDPVEVARLFDARAERYAHDDWHRRYAERFVAALPLEPGHRVLDAGTGTGFAACAAARRVEPGGRVVGVDVSPAMLRNARLLSDAESLANVELLHADATSLSAFAPASFDVVMCSAGLLYMPVEQALREWHRILTPDGTIAFSSMRAGSPSAGRIFRDCAAELGVHLQDASAPLGSEERCRLVLESAGFDRIHVVADRVDFDDLDPVTAWEANYRSAGHAAVRSLGEHEQTDLKRRYLAALQRAKEDDLATASSAEVLYAIGRRGTAKVRLRD